jgi:hypothetical protein
VEDEEPGERVLSPPRIMEQSGQGNKVQGDLGQDQGTGPDSPPPVEQVVTDIVHDHAGSDKVQRHPVWHELEQVGCNSHCHDDASDGNPP